MKAWIALFCVLFAVRRSTGVKQKPFVEPRIRQDTVLKGYVSISADGTSLQFSHDVPNSSGDMVAEGSFSDASHHKSNFGQLRIRTRPGRDDRLQMRAAGFLEGFLTAERLFDHVFNFKYWFQAKGNGTRAIRQWLATQDDWVRKQAATHGKQSTTGTTVAAAAATAGSSSKADSNKLHSFWYAVSLVLEQMDGLLDGYNARVGAAGPAAGLSVLSKADLLLINAFGDMNDLLPMFITDNDAEVTRDLTRLSPDLAWHRLATGGHCSALVKVTGDLTDLMVGHTTWATYYAMVRIYKHYDFDGLSDPRVQGRQISMSSYPGTVSSVDDFYILGPTRMVVLETTNDVYDTSLYNSVVPESALSYHRIFAANVLSAEGAEWVEWAKVYHSGTYNNQYMVVDLKRFTPGQELKPGLLTVMELLPGFSESADVTHELEHGFWPSYNVPYFRTVYEKAGYPVMRARLAALGPAYSKVVSGLSYQLAPRAKIFRRDAGAVNNMTMMISLLRSNKWANDTYSENDVWGTICARGDLSPTNPSPYGCMDAKVTSYAMAMRMGALAVSGPSAQGGLPAFSWSKAAEFAKGPHRGMPEVFHGRFELHQP